MKRHWIFAVACLSLPLSSAFADQCELISAEQASNALNFIKPASQIVRFCEPCGDKDFPADTPETVDRLEVKTEMVGNEPYWAILINNKGIDLAYTFIRNQEGTYLNLSKLANCPSSDVSVGFSADHQANK